MWRGLASRRVTRRLRELFNGDPTRTSLAIRECRSATHPDPRLPETEEADGIGMLVQTHELT